MQHDLWTQYFDAVDQALDALPAISVELFDTVILTSTRANLKLRIRFRSNYLLAISEALLLSGTNISREPRFLLRT